MRRYIRFPVLLLIAGGFLSAAGWFGVSAQNPLPPELSPPSIDDLVPPVENDAIDEPAPAIEPEAEAKDELETLFADLKAAKDATSAKKIAYKIQQIWLKSGSPTIDLLMARAAAAMEAKEYGLSLDLLDTVTRLAPDYVEGWNRRATVYYLQEEFGRSLVDIERVLNLEPRHWGAISGLGIILRRLERRNEALTAFRRVLDLNPNSENARKLVDDLELETAGEEI